MVTAYDIIFFWVARMIFSALEYTDKIPFKDVLIHGLIRDNLGRKMSKSLGNGVDPIEIIDKYGADTLRFTLLNGVGIGQDSRYSKEKIESTSYFINKIWNASRFVVDNVNKIKFKHVDLSNLNLTLADKWILSELNKTIKKATRYYEKYDLGMVASEMYDFVWYKYCDWYIEESKITLNNENANNTANVLVYVLDKILKLMHPIIPFVTEEIYLNLPNSNKTIMLEEFPLTNKKLEFKVDNNTMQQIMDIVKSVRNLRTEMKIADNVKTDLYVVALKKTNVVKQNLEIIKKLAFGKNIELLKNENAILDKSVSVVNELIKIIIPTNDLVDVNKERERLNAELKTVESELTRANGMLNNTGFTSRAPQHLIDAEKEKIAKYTALKQNILNSIEKLK
jgi:valyl-tRNA synthetase